MALLNRKKDVKTNEAETKVKAEPKASKPVKEEKVVTSADETPKEIAKKANGPYFVSPHPSGGWQVKKANADKALKKFKTKAEAEVYAKQVATNQGSFVVRQKKDGKIQKKR